jgi:hypothetical protein
MDDGFFVWVEDVENRFVALPLLCYVGAGIKEVTDVELLEVLITVELFVIGIGDRLELRLVLRGKYSLRVAAEL